jgi:hypothetical protein
LKADEEEVAAIAYLLEGRLLPAFEGVETGMGERTVALSIAAATKCSIEDVTKASSRLGDLGLVTEELILVQSARNYCSGTFIKVCSNLHELAGAAALKRNKTNSQRFSNKRLPWRADISCVSLWDACEWVSPPRPSSKPSLVGKMILRRHVESSSVPLTSALIWGLCSQP